MARRKLMTILARSFLLMTRFWNPWPHKEGFSSVIKNQLSFNKMIETQVAQLASSCPNVNTGKLPGQPEVPSKENVNAVTARGGKSTQEPPFPQDAGTRRKAVSASHADAEEEE